MIYVGSAVQRGNVDQVCGIKGWALLLNSCLTLRNFSFYASVSLSIYEIRGDRVLRSTE